MIPLSNELIKINFSYISLNKAGRWVPTTKNTTRQAGAQFFTFINPNEQLAGAAFPPLGCFAFLFRRPFDPPDERDRYFPILPAE